MFQSIRSQSLSSGFRSIDRFKHYATPDPGFDMDQPFSIKTVFSGFRFKRYRSFCSDKINFFVASLSLSIHVLKDVHDIAKDNIVQCFHVEFYRKVRCLYCKIILKGQET